MRIKEITDERITFDNGNYITYDHEQNCCERNYADFSCLQDEAGIMSYDFPEDLDFEIIDGFGFRFGGIYRKFFIPCYSVQNGWYSSDIDIYYHSSDDTILYHAGLYCQEDFY